MNFVIIGSISSGFKGQPKPHSTFGVIHPVGATSVAKSPTLLKESRLKSLLQLDSRVTQYGRSGFNRDKATG